MHAAAQLIGDERYDAFRDIEHDLVRDAAPSASMRTLQRRDFFSQRIGCQLYRASPYSGANLDHTSACGRRSRPTTRLPTSPTGVAHVPVRLSSEMDNTITVDYATADGTAHEGDDYVAASGTLTFAPHERLKYVDVTINADGAGEPDETFFLNLSNESSGTMVDPQAVVTITETPPPPPPPPPPPRHRLHLHPTASASTSAATPRLHRRLHRPLPLHLREPGAGCRG